MKLSAASIIATYAVITLLLFLQPAKAQVVNPNGALQSLSPEHIRAQTLSGSHFNEFWTYHFFLDEGLKVHITFSAANFGSLKSPVTGVRVSVHGFDGNTYQLSREYPIEHLVQHEDTFKFEPRPGRTVWFKGELPNEHEVRVETSKDGIDYDIHLKLSDIVQGVKWGEGIYMIGSERIGIFTHIPYAKASGFVEINGDRRSVSGTAYMDHTFQNQTTTRLMSSGYRFISHTDSYNWEAIYFMLPSDDRDKMAIGHRIRSVDGQLDVFESNNIQRMDVARTHGKRFAQTMEVMMIHPEGRLEIVTIKRTQDDERFSVLSELSWVARRAARSFLGGEVLEFRGEGELHLPGDRKLQGFYNFFLVD